MTSSTGDNPDRTPRDRGLVADPRRTPKTPKGGEGKTYDGLTIPPAEMVDNPDGADPEALKRFQESSVDPTELLAQLAAAKRQGVAHRPTQMTKGDIHPTEWMRLMRLYNRLREHMQKREQFSPLAFSLRALLENLTLHGFAETENILNGVLAAYGWEDDNIAAFNTAVAIVWSMAADASRPITPEMLAGIQQLFAELGLDEDEIMGR